jgi:hypothetical protein
MEFVATHEFAVSAEELERAMLDPAYLAFMEVHHPLLERVTERERSSGARLTRRVHYAPKPAFEHLGPKKLAPEWFEFDDESTWDPEAKRLTFVHVPSEERVRRRLSTRGELRFERVGPDRTRRVARVEISVRDLPFMMRPFAGMAEQMLVREARRMMDAEADTLSQFIAERARGQAAAAPAQA